MRGFLSIAVLCLAFLSGPAGAQGQPEKTPPDIGKCLSFLEQHPDSPEADAVSDVVCLYLLNGLGPNATQKDFDEAARYARSEEMKALVCQRRQEHDEALAAKKAYLRARERWNIGLGVYAATWLKNNDAGLFLTGKMGGEHLPLNGMLSLGLSYWNLFLPKGADNTFRGVNGFVSLGGRLNIGWRSSFPILFIDSSIGVRTPIRLSGRTIMYKYYNHIADEPLKPCPYLTLGIGRRSGKFEWRIGAIYDITPAYRQQMIYETSYLDYYQMRPIIDERWRVAVSAMIYLKR